MTREIAPRIVIDSDIRFGRPVIQGTRVPMDIILGKLAGGMAIETASTEYGVTTEDVRAAIHYASNRNHKH